MLTTASEVKQATLSADVCILGAGPAGITLAVELTNRGKTVVLLEAGTLSAASPVGLDAYSGPIMGPRKYPLQGSRLRMFGGTTGHWGGWCRPLDPADWRSKPYIENSGWPIGLDELSPWYEKAHDWLEIESQHYALKNGVLAQGKNLLDVEGFDTRFFRFSPPTRFAQRYRKLVEDNSRLNCVLDATACRVIAQASDRISSVGISSESGRTFNVEANQFVVSMGGIENARFLLNAAKQLKSSSLGELNWLGRGFMDHLGWRPGLLTSARRLDYQRFGMEEEGPVMPIFVPTERTLEREEMVNFCMTLIPTSDSDGIDSDYAKNFWVGGDEGHQYICQMIWEPSPYEESKITLDEELGPHGLHRAKVQWRVHPDDRVRLERSVAALFDVLTKDPSIRLTSTRPVTADNFAQRIGNGWHHMGTTRMSDTKITGVVDTNCRVHGIENLFVAGSSVFPSVGFSNPTLTIAALSCRLAQHLG